MYVVKQAARLTETWEYKESPDSTGFAPPADRTNESNNELVIFYFRIS